jgi:protein transport protein SEC13
MARPSSAPTHLAIPNIERVTDSCVNPDGTLLGFLYIDGSVRVFEADEHRKFVQIAETPPCCRRAISISMTSLPDVSDMFVVGDELGRTYLFHRAKPDEFSQALTFSQHKGPINSIAFAPLSLSFACGSSDGTVSVTVCDMKTWSVFPVRVGGSAVTSVSWSGPSCLSFVDRPNSSNDVRLVAACADGQIAIFEHRDNGPLVLERPPIAAHRGPVNAASWRPLAGFSRAEIATCGADRAVALWTIEVDGSVERVTICECEEEPVDVKWSSCGFILSVSSGLANVSLWRESNGRTWKRLETDE